ncbi:23S rRNA (uracil(1939)-C(5))-methyltransferase RlmD [Hazenella sp. IB182353]|uniref:23S rRNA (uracil(1939)-C(5))-methyltransferase RlmD n=1 Tax=Polycladospora coralii TaxID=2771432 RepID=UPI0017462247|nr:23S rRNA (uracil(1939)-C(5))-methyltransferase RlmD [Polycladospora coralii]MBS7531700.1 23S rRNA (uracil(1939)-C(5))-methyltransferase RlmD [Polycladospora coralii]
MGKQAQKQIKLKKGEVVPIRIRSLGINGEGVGFIQKQVVFVDGAIPGEELLVRISEVNRKFAKAKTLKLKKKSAYRIEPACSVYTTCGGCQLQHIDKRMQARLKREQIEEAFNRYTGLEELPLEKTIRMSEPWGYRNKAQLPLVKDKHRVRMGIYAPQSHDLVEIDDCMVQHPVLNHVLEEARKIVEQLKIPIYDEKKHRGALRYLVARISFATEEVQFTFVSRVAKLEQEEALIHAMRTQLPQVKSIYLNHNPDETSLVMGENNRILWGEEKLTEKLGDLTYRLSPRAFFQLNPLQTKRLYEEISHVAALTGKETVVDAYCGVGTIGLWLAKEAKQVIGMDTVSEAITDAKENATLNDITNATFHAGKAETLLPQWVKDGLQPDLVIADPPRTGLAQEFLDTLVQLKLPRFIYVSCNPSTLAKDSKYLLEAGFEVKRIVPLDMFPQTAHVECVALIELK